MKKVWLLTLCLLLWALPARAQVLPLFADGGTKQFADYAYTPDYTCDVWVYAPGAPTDTWLLQCIEAGYTVEKTQLEGYDVYRAADREGQYALLFPNYSGAAMLMVQKGILYAPDAPTPTPVPTPQPTATPQGHWESVTVEVDCPACASGVCPHCHGTGVFRLYGVATTCEKKCAQCDGGGTYTTSRMIFVYD